MKLDLNLTEHFTEPIEQVWHAITDSQMLALWLMENNFEARVGARFVLRRLDPPRGWRGWAECEVLELQKPNRMVWHGPMVRNRASRPASSSSCAQRTRARGLLYAISVTRMTQWAR